MKQFDGNTEYRTAYTYDNAGNQTSLITGAATNAPHTTTYAYNKLGQVISETDPMGGTKTAAYDYLGNVTGGTTKAGETITNTYNDWNLPIMQTVTGTNADTNETRTDTRSFTYDNLGRKISATNESGTATYEYDDFGRLTKETDVTGAVKEYTYDENGNRLTFTLTIDGIQQMNATYTYDKLNQLTGVTIGGDTTTYGYDENGNIVNKTTGQFVTTYDYNAGNLLTEMETNHPNRKYAVSGYTATYYLDGNVRERQDDGDWSSYTYDGLNRLIQDNGTEPLTYTYDAYGNIAQKSRNIMGPEYEITNYTYNANNQLVQSDEEHVDYMYNETGPLTITRYVYDANGNLTSKTPQILGEGSINSGMSLSLIGEVTQEQLGYYLKVEQYAYNGFGQLTHAAVNDNLAEYAYNPDGLRVSKTVNEETTTHILDGANVVADVTSDNISKYNRGRELISIEQDGRKGYYMFNGHGNVMQIVDENKDWWVSNWFTAYGGGSMSGEELNGFQNPFGYCGEYYDGETGQYYLRARYYSPEDGRFVSEDPHWNTGNMIFGDNAGDNPVPSIAAIMQSGNLYGYCSNNPVMRIDPTGAEWGYIRDFANQWSMIFGSPQYEFINNGVMVSLGGTANEIYGIFKYDGGIYLKNGGRVVYRASNDNGRLYMDRADFYKAMGINYKIGEVRYVSNGPNEAISIGAGIGVAYVTKNWNWLLGFAAGYGADIVTETILNSVNPPTNMKVIVTVGEVQNGEFYESILTAEYYEENGDDWIFVKSITQYNGRFNESVLN